MCERDIFKRVVPPARGLIPRRDARRVRRQPHPCSLDVVLGRGLGDERGQYLDEGGRKLGIERSPGLVLHQPDRALMVERLVIGPLGRHRVEVVDDGEDAGTERNLIAPQPLRVAFAVPPFVVAQDQRCDRIWEGHRGDDFCSHLRMNPNLLELFLRERSGLGQDVLGHGELADVVQQRRRPHALNLRLREPDGFRQARRIHLHAPDVHLSRLIFRVDRPRERFNRRQVEI